MTAQLQSARIASLILLLLVTGCSSASRTISTIPKLPEISDYEVDDAAEDFTPPARQPHSWDGIRFMPVVGIKQSQISNNFGAPRDGGKRSHKGIDIFAPEGRELVAATSGYVNRSYNNLGGNSIWLQGDDGINYYYAHLSRYEASAPSGTRVDGGDVIGFVGKTGNAKNTPAHLHFEMRDNGVTVNPYSTLRSHDLVVIPVGGSRQPDMADRGGSSSSNGGVTRPAPSKHTAGTARRSSTASSAVKKSTKTIASKKAVASAKRARIAEAKSKKANSAKLKAARKKTNKNYAKLNKAKGKKKGRSMAALRSKGRGRRG